MHPSRSFQRFQAAQAAQAAQAMLGGEHPLARAEERMRWLRAQAAADAALVTGSAAGILAGATELLALLLAAAAVQVGIVVGLLAAAGVRRRRALELIAAGRAALPLAAVRRERARLARRVGALATSLERMRVDARRPMRNRPVVAPLYFPSVIREVDAELAQTARLLRDGTPDLAAVARTEELLGGESSPLYGPDVLRLREELARLQYALSARVAS
jgi:hypothetical protein